MEAIRTCAGLTLCMVFFAGLCTLPFLGIGAVAALAYALGMNPNSEMTTNECNHLSVYEYVCHKR